MIERRKLPEETGYELGLYTFDELPPAVANYIEDRFLKRADQLAYDALCKLLIGELDHGLDLRSAWSRFIVTTIR